MIVSRRASLFLTGAERKHSIVLSSQAYGSVRDLEGRAVPGINVAAMRLSYSYGRPQFAEALSKTTDDRGEFRIFPLPPGEYYVGVTPAATAVLPGPTNNWVKTFFPGVTDPLAAAALVVSDGAEVPGIDFSIQPIASIPTFKISGTATNPLAVPDATTGAVNPFVNYRLVPAPAHAEIRRDTEFALGWKVDTIPLAGAQVRALRHRATPFGGAVTLTIIPQRNLVFAAESNGSDLSTIDPFALKIVEAFASSR